MRRAILTTILLSSATALATPADGDYSQMGPGEVGPAKEGVPSCGKTDVQSHEIAVALDKLFKETHLVVWGEGKKMAIHANFTPDAVTPIDDVKRTDHGVTGWLKTGDTPPHGWDGDVWLIAGVADPVDTLRETMKLAKVVSDPADRKKILCADGIMGITERDDLPAELQSPKKKPKK